MIPGDSNLRIYSNKLHVSTFEYNINMCNKHKMIHHNGFFWGPLERSNSYDS